MIPGSPNAIFVTWKKIVYSERIREFADILARKLVVRKAKNLWATAMQHTKNALAVDYSAAMDVSRDCMLSHVRRYQNEGDAARELIEKLE